MNLQKDSIPNFFRFHACNEKVFLMIFLGFPDNKTCVVRHMARKPACKISIKKNKVFSLSEIPRKAFGTFRN